MTRLHTFVSVAAVSVSMAGLYVIPAKRAAPENVREFTLTAQKFEFSLSVINIKRGDHVRLTVTALDAEHGFKLDAFHVVRKLPKGEAVTVEFTADQAGTFPFQCSHICGMGHKKMKGQLIVE